MKKASLFILFLLITPSIAQKTPSLEIFLKTRNTGGDTTHFQAIAESTPIWNPLNSNIITGDSEYSSSTLTIVGDYSGLYKGWHTDGGDDWDMPSLGWCELYTIAVTNSGYTASFEVETFGAIFQGDVFIVYDYESDEFYYDGTNNIVTSIDLYEHPEYLQPTTPQNFLCTNPSSIGQNPHFAWSNPSDPTGVAFKYEIYRQKYPGSYSTVASGITSAEWTDYEIVINTNSTDRYFYYTKAYTDYSPKSAGSNIEMIRGDLTKTTDPFLDDPIKTSFDSSTLSIFPNPFNYTTTIWFSIVEESRIDIRLYNLLGRQVSKLVQQTYYSPGKYSVILNAENMQSGVYFIVYQNNSKLFISKLVLIK